VRLRSGPATVTSIEEVRTSAAPGRRARKGRDDRTSRHSGRGHPREGSGVTGTDSSRYPFSAIVGSDDMALALVLTTISPEVGGVLVRGEKGTAKTTIVRALAHVLPPIQVVDGCRFSCDPLDPDPDCPDGSHPESSRTATTRPARLVELPVGASEDRVIGSLDLQQALGAGHVAFQPGLLAAAHRGLLYVDEVNLLHDHLVDLLLDAAAMGRSTVEREGVSVAHASRIVLIGTMNPEEGELRPQLLDRFGLTVEVAAPREPRLRAEVIRRRMAYDRDAAAFVRAYADQEDELRGRLSAAQSLVDSVELSDDQLTTIAQVCSAFDVDGLRADIVTARAAAAHAAWHGRSLVVREDIRAAARLALPHRRRRQPFDAPGLDEGLLDQLLGEEGPEPDPGDGGTSTTSGRRTETSSGDQQTPGAASDQETQSVEGPTPALSAETSSEKVETPPEQGKPTSGHDGTGWGRSDSPNAERVITPGQAYRTRLFTAAGVGAGEAGRRSRALTSTGRTVGARPMRDQHGQLHLTATIRAAARHQPARGRQSDERLRFRQADLRLAVTEGRESNLVLLAVDASGSMAARRRMEAVKAAALSLLLDAYQRRDKVGLITFRGFTATVALPPTSSVEVAARRLADLPSGGRTPLAEGLLCAAETLRQERIRDPRRRPLLVLVTDGRATSGADAVIKSRLAADQLRRTGVSSVVVDCETGRLSLGLALRLSDHLGAEYVQLGDLESDRLVRSIQYRTGRRRAA
jgi:magnesium chelatase subunit D